MSCTYWTTSLSGTWIPHVVLTDVDKDCRPSKLVLLTVCTHASETGEIARGPSLRQQRKP